MANDPALGIEIGQVVAEFSKLLNAEEVAPSILARDEERAFYLLVRESMLGLALGRATNCGKPLGHNASSLLEFVLRLWPLIHE
jgi:hypothetical protein